ncbi:MAG: hypothetical protein PVI44_10950, partial [Balneolaceae bacterium]
MMPNPIDVEKHFSELIRSFDGSLTFKHRWIRIFDFLRFIQDDFGTYDTYCQQLVPYFPVFQSPLSFTGIDPEILVSINNLLEKLQEEVSFSNEAEQFRKAQDSLQCTILFLYTCLGDIEAGIRAIGPEVGSVEERSQEKPFSELIKNYSQSGRTHVADCLRKASEWWDKVSHQDPDSAFVPVVERIGKHTLGGRLRLMRVRVVGEREKNDQYEHHYTVVGAERGGTQGNEFVARIVRPVIDDRYPYLIDRFFDLQFSFRQSLGLQKGRSSELAAGVLGFCSITRYAGQREQFCLEPRVGLTGSLSENGAIEEISDDSICPKIDAAFFSWIRYLVVPDAQKKPFEECRDKLLKKYPGRRLQIIGLSNFGDFIYDRRIVGHNIASRPEHYFIKAWDRKFSLAGISIILVLLLVIGRLVYGPIDKNPVEGKFEGTQLKIFNKSGQLLKAFDAGPRRAKTFRGNNSNQRFPQVQFYDLDEDGTNEVFWYESSFLDHRSQHISNIKAWSLTGDSLIWQFPVQFDLQFPRKNSIVDDEFELKEFQIVDIGDGKPLLVANANAGPMFPSVIFSLNVSTGKIDQTYVHAGRLYDMAVKDLTGDGIPEVIATGMNNAFWKASITVLDIYHMQGHAPVRGDYIVKGFKPAKERYYLMIPKTILGKYYDPVEKSNKGNIIETASSGELLEFEIIDSRPPELPKGASEPYLVAYFEKNM